MTSLTDFLLARIAATEASICDCGDWDGHPGDCAIFSPVGRFVAAECGAKRRLIENATYEKAGVRTPYGPDHEETVSILALPYADHPDYREEWRP